MYETEANSRVESSDQIPSGVLTSFRELRAKIRARTLLPWGEHCTECVWPSCYTTCDLYSPREDFRCRRFVDGMVRIDCPGSVNSYVLKVRFKRWGKLWTPGNARLYSLQEADKRETRDYQLGRFVYHLPLRGASRKFATGKRYFFKTAVAQWRRPSDQPPTAFIVECYNPGDVTVSLSLTMRPRDAETSTPFQTLINVQPGFVRAQISVADIPTPLLSSQFEVELTPNDIADGTTLYFGLMDFVQGLEPAKVDASRPSIVKCVAWDLDNTLWKGVLVEDGADKLQLKRDVVEVIRELDRRGILNSVASKNNFDEAWAVLTAAGIADLFVAPQISWQPKSAAMANIAAALNLGIDSILFVDDSTFELEEVAVACRGVRTVKAADFLSLLSRPDCNIPVTAEASARRRMYQQNEIRQKHAEGFGANYAAFLRDCQLELRIGPLTSSNIMRVHELTQRTNQMNFSGTRYQRQLLEEILENPHLDTYVVRCRDRFGDYGTVGFSIVDRREPRMTDLMFSCRIQSKRVEHAFLGYLLRRYIAETARDVWANYRKTERNQASGRVFSDLGLEEVQTQDGVTSLMFRKDRTVPDDGIVTILSDLAFETVDGISTGATRTV